MNIVDLLSELRENILHDRSDRVEGSPDLLWSDATLLRYINEAERRFARRGLVLRDGATPEATQVYLIAGQRDYVLHPSLLAIVSGKLVGEPVDLARTGHSALDVYRGPSGAVYDTAVAEALPPGKPLAFSTDEAVSTDDAGMLQAVTLRVYPEPTEAYAGQVIQLRVVRMPMRAFRAEDLTAPTPPSPEIPEAHHLEMLDWAAYLALRIADLDAGSPARAAEFAASFEGHVALARREAMRKLFAPQQWGFGRNGFSWER